MANNRLIMNEQPDLIEFNYTLAKVLFNMWRSNINFHLVYKSKKNKRMTITTRPCYRGWPRRNKHSLYFVSKKNFNAYGKG